MCEISTRSNTSSGGTKGELPPPLKSYKNAKPLVIVLLAI